MVVPSGMLRSCKAFPDLMSALAEEITVSPTASPTGQRMYRFSPSRKCRRAMRALRLGSYRCWPLWRAHRSCRRRKINHTKATLVAAAPEARSHASEMVAATGRRLGLGESLERLIALREIGESGAILPRTPGVVGLIVRKHPLTYTPSKKSIFWPGRQT